jgi:hypothetical protein
MDMCAIQKFLFYFFIQDDVHDADTAEWGVERFDNLTQFLASPARLAQELEAIGVNSPFVLFPNGSVKVNTYFNADMSGYFIVNVRVRDKGGLTDEAQLRVRTSLYGRTKS